MKQIQNKCDRDIAPEEWTVLMHVAQELEKIFRKRIDVMYLNPDETNPGDLFNIVIRFDRFGVKGNDDAFTVGDKYA